MKQVFTVYCIKNVIHFISSMLLLLHFLLSRVHRAVNITDDIHPVITHIKR